MQLEQLALETIKKVKVVIGATPGQTSEERPGICTRGVEVAGHVEGQRYNLEPCKEGGLDLIRETAGSSRAELRASGKCRSRASCLSRSMGRGRDRDGGKGEGKCGSRIRGQVEDHA